MPASSTSIATWFPIGVLSVRTAPKGRMAGAPALPGTQRKGGKWQGFTPARYPFPLNAAHHAPFSFLRNPRGVRRGPNRIRDAALDLPAPDPAGVSRGCAAPEQAPGPLCPEALLTTPAPATSERTARLRPCMDGNGAEYKRGGRGVDKFCDCQEGRLPSSFVIPDGLQRRCMTRSGNQTSVHRRCCMFPCCLDI